MKRLPLLLALLLMVSVVFIACKKEEAAVTPEPETKTEEVTAEATPEAETKEEPQAEAPAAGDIKLYTRDATSGTREAFQEGIGFDKKNDVLTEKAVETSGNGDMAAKVGKDELGIGYVSLTTDFAANNLHPVHFEGVEPTVENVLNDSYSLKRPFSYVTRAKGDFESEQAEALTAAFLVFLTQSEEGLSAVESAGGIVDMSQAKPWSELVETIEGFDPAGDYSEVNLRTRGSTSVEKTLKAALEAFQAEVQFQFNMNHTGSGDGFKRTLGEEKDGANAGDIGFASRPFGDKEDVSTGAFSGVYCQDAVVVVVNASNPLKDITAAQMKSIVLGEVTSWDALQ